MNKTLDQRIADAQQALDQLLAEQARREGLLPVQSMAIDLHDSLCYMNHDDGCGWGWEIQQGGVHDWNGHAHKRWLEKATIISVNFPDASVDKAIELVKALR